MFRGSNLVYVIFFIKELIMSQAASPTPKSWNLSFMPGFTMTGEELRSVPYRNGDIFVCHEHQEDVMVDTVTERPDGSKLIKMVSLDKTFDGNPIEYLVSEQMLKKYYTATGRKHPHMEDGYKN